MARSKVAVSTPHDATLTPFRGDHFLNGILFRGSLRLKFLYISFAKHVETIMGLVAKDQGLGGESTAQGIHG
jgi:hypothetical protein